MKHQDHIPPADVRDALTFVGVDVTPSQADLLARHAALVLEANKRMNLTRIVEPHDVISLHIADALAFLPYVGTLEDPIVDIGSGAGYPGVPLAILGHDVVLCESVRKKAGFLSDTAATLGVQVTVAPIRAEELALERPSGFRTVVARAVSALPSLVELAAPLLCDGGRLIALKGAPEEEEIERGRRAAAVVGLRETMIVKYALAGGETRHVLVYERCGSPSTLLPRRSGLAQRQPLE